MQKKTDPVGEQRVSDEAFDTWYRENGEETMTNILRTYRESARIVWDAALSSQSAAVAEEKANHAKG
jgi:hypothetical protein